MMDWRGDVEPRSPRRTRPLLSSASASLSADVCTRAAALCLLSWLLACVLRLFVRGESSLPWAGALECPADFQKAQSLSCIDRPEKVLPCVL